MIRKNTKKRCKLAKKQEPNEPEEAKSIGS